VKGLVTGDRAKYHWNRIQPWWPSLGPGFTTLLYLVGPKYDRHFCLHLVMGMVSMRDT
jgi:hypothetical protein